MLHELSVLKMRGCDPEANRHIIPDAVYVVSDRIPPKKRILGDISRNRLLES
jgi:hypothetical protein